MKRPAFLALVAYANTDGVIAFGIATPEDHIELAKGKPSRVLEAVVAAARHDRSTLVVPDVDEKQTLVERLKRIVFFANTLNNRQRWPS